MFLKQYYLGCLSHASYLIGDEATKTAAVVDPQRDIEHYLADAARQGFTIRHVFLTHFHADFVAGHLELAARSGATIRLGARARAEYEFTPMREGERLEFGNVRLSILETPGHTPEGISILVYDLAKNREKPLAVLTGDTLFIGDVGRPDLMASSGTTAEELAGELYDSLHAKLLALPDETFVYPAHGAGSACGKKLSNETVSTIGTQRASNYMLCLMTRERFVAEAVDLPPALLRLRCAAQQAAAHDARGEPRPRAAAALARRAARVAGRRRAGARHAPLRRVRARPIFAQRQHRPVGQVRHLGPARCSIPRGRSRSCARRAASTSRACAWGASASIGSPASSRRMSRVLRGLELVRSFERIDPPEMYLCSVGRGIASDVRNPGERASVRIEGTLAIPPAELEARLDEVPHEARWPCTAPAATARRSPAACSPSAPAGGTWSTCAAAWPAGEQSGLPTARGAAPSSGLNSQLRACGGRGRGGDFRPSGSGSLLPNVPCEHPPSPHSPPAALPAVLGACSAPRVDLIPRIGNMQFGGTVAADTTGVSLTSNDVRDDLGLDQKSNELGGRADSAFGGSVVTLAYSPASFDGNGTLHGQLTRDGVTLPVGTNVARRSSSTWARWSGRRT